jgi:transposase
MARSYRNTLDRAVLQVADSRNARRFYEGQPFSQRFEEAVGLACESAAVRRVAKQFGLSPSTVRAIDIRYRKRWATSRRKPALRQMGIDELYLGKKQKFLTVVSNLQTGEPLWLGRERKKETLDEFLGQQLSAFPRRVVQAACVDMWEPFRQSLEQWVPQCQIIYNKFHVLQHASQAVDEVRRAEFFRKGGPARDIVRGCPARGAAAPHSGDAVYAHRQRVDQVEALGVLGQDGSKDA